MGSKTADEERIPPHNLEAERAAIGACLGDPVNLDAVLAIVRAEDFYAHTHGRIFEAIAHLARTGAPVDAISVSDRLRARGELEKVGGFSYLAQLGADFASSVSVAYSARLVREKSTLRRLIEAGGALARLGYEGEVDVADTLTQANRLVGSALDAGTTRRNMSMADAIDRYQKRVVQEGGLAFNTPWPMLDDLTGAFIPGELVIWAGDSGLGKSQVLTMLAAYLGEFHGHQGRVAVFPTEMGQDKTVARFLALYSGVSTRRQRNNPDDPLTASELERLAIARGRLEGLPIEMFDADRAISSEDVILQTRRLHREAPLIAIIVDTFGMLADVEETGRQSLASIQETIIKKFARLALELGIVVHIVHHLNREGNDRLKKPTKKALRNGGNLDGSASSLIFLWEDEKKRCWFVVAKAREGDEMDVGMHRHGSRVVWLQNDQDRAWCEPIGIVQDSFLEETG